ncbi:hypothetical protein SESBI_07222 [Sesbania bispinosa]|nr:hypothetical protein SESBI_07222 [Sesbania bispinosa]
MKTFLANGVDDLGILVIQFAEVNEYLGKVSLHTVSNSTRLLWKPQIPEVLSFKDIIVHNCMDMHASMKIIGHYYCSYSPIEEFLLYFPRKTIEDLHLTEEEGHFICLEIVEGIVKNDYWWYMACKCHISVNLYDSSAYYCSGCEGYRLKLEVSDHTETAHFVLFDYDVASLLSKSCASMVGDAKVLALDYPAMLDNIIGKELLFKFEVKAEREFKFDDSFKIRRTCDDEGIIKEFKNEGSIRTSEMDVPPGDNIQASEFVPLSDLYNDGEISLLLVGECSTAYACLAPQKRKSGPRVGHGAFAKKSGHAKVLKIEKD